MSLHRQSLFFKLSVLAAVVIFLGLSCSITKADNVATSPSTAKLSREEVFENWNWTLDNWTGSDRPFAEARTKIDQQMASSPNAQAIFDAYQKVAAANPGNALDQFEWAYASYKLMQIPHKEFYDGELKGQLVVALANATQPHTYDYDRLRFLLEGGRAPSRSLAVRLLQHNPNDVPVKWSYAAILSLSKLDTDNEQALKIGNDIIAHKQDIPNGYFSMCAIYWAVAINQNIPDDYKKALQACKRFLALTPSYDWRRAMAIRIDATLVKEIQQRQ